MIYENTRINDEFLDNLSNIYIKIGSCYFHNRILDSTAHKGKKIEDIEQIGYGTKYGLQTPDILGIKRKIHTEEKIDLDILRKHIPEKKNESVIRIGGYSLLRMPSPSPSKK